MDNLHDDDGSRELTVGERGASVPTNPLDETDQVERQAVSWEPRPSPTTEGPAVTKKEELLELLQDEDIKRAIVGIVTSDSAVREALLKDGERRQSEATGGLGKRT